MSVFLKNLNILIIEDNLGDYTLIEDYLNEQTDVVVINLATSYSKAKETLGNQKNFDIILLDLSLPDADGIELVGNVVKLAGNTPVIVLTGNSDKNFGINTLSLGISDYLLKDELTASNLNKSIFYTIERSRINRALRESENKYRNLFSQNPLPVWVYDMDSLAFLDVNEAAVKNYGYTREEFLSMTLLDIRPIEDIPLLHSIDNSIDDSKPYLKSIVRHRKKNGDEIWVEVQNTHTNFGDNNARLIISIDVTEKIIAEQALKQSEELFKSLVQEGSDLITIVDTKGVFTYVSPNHEVIVGYGAKDLIGRSAFDFIHEEDLEFVHNQFNELLTEKTVFIKPIRFKHKNNSWIYVESIITNLSDDSAVRGIVSNSRNVTERVEKEQKLKESNERFIYAAKATSDIIWEWNSNDAPYFRAYGYLKLFGYQFDELGDLENFWSSKVHPDDLDATLKIIDEARDNPETLKFRCEYRFLKANGEYAFVKDKVIILRDKFGKPTRMVGAIQNITRRKLEDQRLKLFESIITETTDIVLISEVPIDELYSTIIFANDAFTKVTGFGKDEIIGKSQTIMHGPKTDLDEVKQLINLLKSGESAEIELIHYKKSGEEFWVNICMVPVSNTDGVFTHWIAIQRDITKRKKQECEREQFISDLTQSIKDLKQFAYITSHNLRAPLANLLGLITLLDEIEIKDHLLSEILTGFKSSAEQLNHTVNDLVKVLVIKDNPTSQEKIQIDKLLNQVCIEMSMMDNETKPDLAINFNEAPQITFNKVYMESILFNLLSNAIKFRSPDRPLKISVTTQAANDKIILTFADNGIGLDVDRYRDRIFGFYQRFHNYPDSKGLGLYMIKIQMEALGGSVSVQSEVNVGTKFSLFFKN